MLDKLVGLESKLEVAVLDEPTAEEIAAKKVADDAAATSAVHSGSDCRFWRFCAGAATALPAVELVQPVPTSTRTTPPLPPLRHLLHPPAGTPAPKTPRFRHG